MRSLNGYVAHLLHHWRTCELGNHLAESATAVVLHCRRLCSPRDSWQRLERRLFVTTRGRRAAGLQWAEARGAAEHPSTHRAASATKDPPAHGVRGAKAATTHLFYDPEILRLGIHAPGKLRMCPSKNMHKNIGGSFIHKSLKTVQKSTDRIMDNKL